MLTDLLHRLRAVLRRDTVERELDEELRFHVDHQSRKYVEAGLTPEEAARRTRLDFGGLDQIKEECRDARGVGVVDETWRNLRYACRMLLKRRAFALVTIVTLALAIGANSAVFSAIDTILLRPLPFPDADQLVRIEQYEPRAANASSFVAPPRLQDWQRMNATFGAISGYFSDDISETSGELPERIACAWVAPQFFQVWGIEPAFGRIFVHDEERFGGPVALVVSERLWKRRFGSVRVINGQRLRIGQQFYPIVGVMPATFRFPIRDVDVWGPSPFDAPYARMRQSTWFTVVGRIKPAATIAQAQADLEKVQAQLATEYPATDASLAVRMRPLKDVTVGGIGRSLWTLFGAVSLLLLIACTNIAALLLARTADRRREIVIRNSLGASRMSIIRLLMTEALVLATLGSALGLVVAAGAFRAFRGLAGALPRISELRLDWTLVAYSLGCAVGATLLFGLLPAVRSTKHLADSLAHSGRAVTPATTRLQWVLVGIQISLAVTLLFGAGLLLRSFEALARVPAGFDPSHVLTFRISGNWGETVDLKAMRRRIDSTLEILRATPGVEAAATSLAAPGVRFEYRTEVRIVEGTTNPDDKIIATSRVISDGYFRTMQIPLLSGEPCGTAPNPPTAVANRRFAELYLPGATAVGRHVDQVPPNPYVGAARIAGVVADAREDGMRDEPGPTLYWCNSAAVPAPLFLVRTRTDPGVMAAAIRRKVLEIEPRRSVYELMPLEERISETFAESRLRTVLLTSFAVTAIALAAVGLYGTLSYFVSMRRREIGVRMAMGAVRPRIVSSFLLQGLRVSAAGCVGGLWLAAALGRGLAGVLYGVSPLDPPTFAGVLVVVLLTAVVSSLYPAVRAARTDPMRTLREE
jgi:putative ABC transport system permease protein